MNGEKQNFYNILEDLCKESHITMVQLRKYLGISQSTMASWKSKGGTPNIGTLTKLADYFGVSVEYLRGEDVLRERLGIDNPTLLFLGFLNFTEEEENDFQRLIKMISGKLNLDPDQLAELAKQYPALAWSFIDPAIKNPVALVYKKADEIKKIYSEWQKAAISINDSLCMLNDNGKKEAIKRIEELEEIKAYQIGKIETLKVMKERVIKRLKELGYEASPSYSSKDRPEYLMLARKFISKKNYEFLKKEEWKNLCEGLKIPPYEFLLLKPTEKARVREARKMLEQSKEKIEAAKRENRMADYDHLSYEASQAEGELDRIFNQAYNRLENLKF